MSLTQITLEQLTPEEENWLAPFPGVDKPDFRMMKSKLVSGEWWLIRISGNQSSGLSVVFPDAGKLFIYYLRGRRLFDTVSIEDLLALAERFGLSGLKAETRKIGVLKLILNKGFRLTQVIDDSIYGVEY